MDEGWIGGGCMCVCVWVVGDRLGMAGKGGSEMCLLEPRVVMVGRYRMEGFSEFCSHVKLVTLVEGEDGEGWWVSWGCVV